MNTITSSLNFFPFSGVVNMLIGKKSKKIIKDGEEYYPSELVHGIIRNNKNRLKSFRTYRKLTQAELSEKSGVNISIIRKMEKGENPTYRDLKALSKALNIDIELLKN